MHLTYANEQKTSELDDVGNQSAPMQTSFTLFQSKGNVLL